MKLSQLLLRELDDPRLDGLHLTGVEMTPDLSHARVAWRATPGASPEAAVAQALERAAGFLRKQLGRSLRLKHVPELEFRHDELVDSGSRMEDVLAALASERAARPVDDEE